VNGFCASSCLIGVCLQRLLRRPAAGGDVAHQSATAGPLDRVGQRADTKTCNEARDAHLDSVADTVHWSQGNQAALVADVGAATVVCDGGVSRGDEGQRLKIGQGVGDRTLEGRRDGPTFRRTLAWVAAAGHGTVEQEAPRKLVIAEPSVPAGEVLA
jgi:hypothetical protein